MSLILNGTREQRTWFNEPLSAAPSDISFFSDSSDGSWINDLKDEDSGLKDGISPEPGVITESGDLCISVGNTITSLMRLSMQVHLSSSTRDKFARCPLTPDFDLQPDVNHVCETLPWVSGNKPLAMKLGRANAQRRMWLTYRRSHSDKLSRDSVSGRLFATTPIEGEQPGDKHETFEDPLPSPTDTKATTFQVRLKRAATGQETLAPSEYPDTFFGKSSIAGGEESEILMPRVPLGVASGRPFQCPYCYKVVEISSKTMWL